MPEFRFFGLPGETDGVRMGEYLSFLAELNNAVISDDRIRLFEGAGSFAVLRGGDFKTSIIEGDINISGGPITAINTFFEGDPIFTATGLNLQTPTFFNLIANGDEDAFVTFLLKGNDRVFGSDRADQLFGLDGRDTIFGQGGEDQIIGGTGADRLSGGGARDALIGQEGSDAIFGGKGNDYLVGAQGADTLSGGAGQDQFVFFAPLGAGEVETITDFQTGIDQINLDPTVFAAAGPVGDLAASAFRRGAAATDADDRIIYNPANGKLYLDVNGDAAGGRTLFAVLDPGLNLKAGDFIIGGIE